MVVANQGDLVEYNGLTGRVVATYTNTAVIDFKEFNEIDPEKEKQVIRHTDYKIHKK
ncbi:DUF2187 family protein [Fictibacillus sp. KIGAM418]|uniref:DUF2187 family protein n=1 Tax=Fictibacillus marinisediminis TaxID=2878389 RepID=A0A9X1XL26_9BACL|nr:DUF2187 family protein [Fictibacillus marinisediminis]MCK6259499.1 DUF2187 family protein [Fictibacillus marinisediminis]